MYTGWAPYKIQHRSLDCETCYSKSEEFLLKKEQLVCSCFLFQTWEVYASEVLGTNKPQPFWALIAATAWSIAGCVYNTDHLHCGCTQRMAAMAVHYWPAVCGQSLDVSCSCVCHGMSRDQAGHPVVTNWFHFSADVPSLAACFLQSMMLS